MKHVMLDIETLGNSSNSAIISIGAVAFDETRIGREFYLNVDPQSCIDAGLKIDVSTIMWWMGQSDAARAVFKSARIFKLEDALMEFSVWFPKDACVWGNGATFDNVIVANAYKAVGMKQPWKYTADRCYRTLKAMYPGVMALKDGGTAHNALDDARYQARHAANILKHIKETQNG